MHSYKRQYQAVNRVECIVEILEPLGMIALLTAIKPYRNKSK